MIPYYISDCKVTDRGWEYGGSGVSQSHQGTCQRWDTDTPHSGYQDLNFHPDSSWGDAANLCRNPDIDPGGIWCYVDNPAIRIGFCQVPICGMVIFIFSQIYVFNI